MHKDDHRKWECSFSSNDQVSSRVGAANPRSTNAEPFFVKTTLHIKFYKTILTEREKEMMVPYDEMKELQGINYWSSPNQCNGTSPFYSFVEQAKLNLRWTNKTRESVIRYLICWHLHRQVFLKVELSHGSTAENWGKVALKIHF